MNLLNEYFQSVYNVTVPEIESPLPGDSNILADFHFSKADIGNLLEKLDISKSRVPDGLPPIFFQKLHCTMAASLCKLFKICRKCSLFPICWKVGMISPLFKKRSRFDVTNYRSVTLLNIGEVFEKLFCAPLVERLATIVTAAQHGFPPTRSIESNIISFIHNLSCSIEDSNSITATLYTDFAKAFDKVPHDILLQKLANYGIGGRLLKLISNYLSERQQFVKADNVKSSFLPVTSGVPQGSCLAPILFLYFINDLPEIFETTKPYLFADDVKMLLQLDRENFFDVAQDERSKLLDWTVSNRIISSEVWFIVFQKTLRW